MKDGAISDAEMMFLAADATWRNEAARILGCACDDSGLIDRKEARGEPGTLLRTAYEVRERTRAEWERIRRVA